MERPPHHGLSLLISNILYDKFFNIHLSSYSYYITFLQYVQHISTVCRYLYSFHWINFSDKNFLKSETIVFPHLKISPIALRFYSQTSIILLPVLLRSTLTANFWPVWRIPKGIGKEPNDPESLFKLESETWFWTTILISKELF